QRPRRSPGVRRPSKRITLPHEPVLVQRVLPGFNVLTRNPRQSGHGLKSRSVHPRPRGYGMGGLLVPIDIGSVTAFQGADLAGAAVGAFFFVIVVLVFLFASLKVVKEYERIVNFRLGKAQAEKGPGIVVVIPGIDKPVRVDLRERFLTIPHQTCITKDNAPVDVDFIVYFKVASAADSVIRVNNFEGAAMGIATTTLRAVVGDIILDEVLSKREEINAILRTKLDEVTTRWGVKVTNVEIREILPPKNVTDAMILQMSAERSRRAAGVDTHRRKTAQLTLAEWVRKCASPRGARVELPRSALPLRHPLGPRRPGRRRLRGLPRRPRVARRPVRLSRLRRADHHDRRGLGFRIPTDHDYRDHEAVLRRRHPGG